MDFTQYITASTLVCIPVLYIIGLILKNTNKVPDNVIPLVLLPIGIVLAMLLMGRSVDALIQGVLVTGAAVYTNQVVKQLGKDK